MEQNQTTYYEKLMNDLRSKAGRLIAGRLMREEREIRDAQDEYNYYKDCEKVAKSRGLIVVIPNDNQLQIDIDSDEQYDEFRRRLSFIDGLMSYTSALDTVSASGPPNRHITLTFSRTFTEVERILFQAALNDDKLRVFLNTARLLDGIPNPSRLFEKPEQEK